MERSESLFSLCVNWIRTRVTKKEETEDTECNFILSPILPNTVETHRNS
jgi:hypothetical protein